ncbi:hypothetical protein AS9A_P20011 (plasmid) [Hoyosella subflava DQS3-9A1]|uniref:Uncharacterized protein n=1 Tax=Hoyosella subflava (strain DSM 45089 / JCM 17490 / NBRC 109087 / DQS3-9A1) TaxID=443218 RepID=F6ESD4_HOYSD|nr:hypothetical protein AS9A_P20011 [Hoyosella subflava DQS3-9A1]
MAAALAQVLVAHTQTANQCFFGFWEVHFSFKIPCNVARVQTLLGTMLMTIGEVRDAV